MTNDYDDEIRTVDKPSCYLCGHQGHVLHDNLTDPSHCAPGQWTLQRCSNLNCGLIWLNPMPVDEDIWKTYRNYFTHADYIPTQSSGTIDRFNYLLLKIHKPIYKLFEHIVGLRAAEKKWRRKSDVMFLDTIPPRGKLLDIGCGRGDLLNRMSALGWVVEGLEVDEKAVEFAREKYRLTVYHNSLENQRFPSDSFDVITMNHVIEHISDPIALLRESLRILKPGGRLIMATPNIVNCLGYVKIGGHWAHLDPPRHLHLFTKSNLAMLTTTAGFRVINTWCAPGYAEGGAMRVSIERRDAAAGRTQREFLQWLEASYLKFLAYYLFFGKKNDDVGEEIFLMATKG